MASRETIGLREAANKLGVHYQTAYQWVRRGELPAHQIGRQYVIAVSSLEAFRQARQAPVPPASRVPRRGFSAALPRFHAALVGGDEATARRVTADYTDTGTSITDIIEGLFAPALRQIGEQWHADEITIAEEHRASAIVEQLIAIHLPRKRGRPRGRAAVATPAGEHHGLSALMATAALRDAGWRVHHLGPDLPVGEISTFVKASEVDVVVLSAATDHGRATARQAIATLAAEDIVAITNEPGMRLPELVVAAEEVRA